MDFIIITAEYNDSVADSFPNYLAPSIKNLNVKCVHITDKKNTDDIKHVSTKYNIGIDVIKKNNLISNNTCVIFAKSDTNIIDDLLLNKLELAFSSNTNLAVVGVVGSKIINEGEALYSPKNKPVNGIIVNNKNTGTHIQYTKNGFFDNIVAVDDALFAVTGSFLTDSNFNFLPDFNTGFGIDVSISAIKMGYDVVCADILVSTNTGETITFTEIKKHIDQLSITKFPIMYANIIQNINSVVEIEL